MADEKKMLIGVGVGVAVLLLVLMRRRDTGAVAATGADGAAAVASGGVAGAPGFMSNINVTANPQLLGMLDRKYMPLFGFVGAGVAGSGVPSRITTNVIVNNNVLPQIARQVIPEYRNSSNQGLNMGVAVTVH